MSTRPKIKVVLIFHSICHSIKNRGQRTLQHDYSMPILSLLHNNQVYKIGTIVRLLERT